MRPFIETELRITSVVSDRPKNVEVVTAELPDEQVALGRQVPVRSVTFLANLGSFRNGQKVNVKVEVE